MSSLNLQTSEDSSEEEEKGDALELDGPDFDPIEFALGEYTNDYVDSET